MSDINTMDAKWRTFAMCVIPTETPDIMRQAHRFSYYAGACAAFDLIAAICVRDEPLTDADREKLDALYNELQRFVADTQRDNT